MENSPGNGQAPTRLNTPFAKYATVVLDLSIDKMLEYGVTEDMAPLLKRGVRVEVPVRGFLRSGYVYSLSATSTYQKILPIHKVLSKEELITEELFELSLWMSKYYCAPLRQVFKIILPASVRKQVKPKQQLFVMRAKTREELKYYCESIRNKYSSQAEILDAMLKVKKGILLSQLLEETKCSRGPVDTLEKKGFLSLDIIRIDRSPLINEEYFRSKPKSLNPEQAQALENINLSLEKSIYTTHLIYGITGSGKTEVYLQAIEKALSMGKGTIMLVPEISLTAQTIERFRSRFEGCIAVLHHRLSQGERLDEWERIKRGEAKIVIGARSAVFSPVVNLGLIIVDEEHESSYKQTDEAPCYHARDIAVKRGSLAKATVLLGSATPSLESYYNAMSNKYSLSVLGQRADAACLPKFTIVDMRKEFDKAKGMVIFSDLLLGEIQKRCSQGEQSILFLNRRGYHSMMLCPKCQSTIKCHHCDVSLTFHLGANILACHLCGFFHAPPPQQCPSCNSPDPLKFKGVGTELIEKSLYAIYPSIRIIRLDADTTRHKGSHQKLLRDFGTGKADVLIGTQMIAKGLHFPEVTLVGVLNSDVNLNIPDYRASETVFQLITQVAGRAGRGQIPGEVIVQTMMPDNQTIKLAAAQDYTNFYEEESAVRQMFGFPPFSQLVKIAFSGENEKQTQMLAETLKNGMLQHLSGEYEILPVIPAGHAKVKDRYRFQFLIKGPNVYLINKVFNQVKESLDVPSAVRILVDVNPLSTFF